LQIGVNSGIHEPVLYVFDSPPRSWGTARAMVLVINSIAQNRVVKNITPETYHSDFNVSIKTQHSCS